MAIPMDVQWMQNFLCLPQCDDARTSGATMALKTNRSYNLDDLEGDDDWRHDYVCPFCYEDFDIATLCSHIEEDHFCESVPVVCPICSTKVGNDLVGHITLQHGHLFKMQRRRLRKAGAASNATVSLLDEVFKPSAAREEALLNSTSSSVQQKPSLGASWTAEQQQQKLEEKALRAKFVQHLILSTIFVDADL